MPNLEPQTSGKLKASNCVLKLKLTIEFNNEKLKTKDLILGKELQGRMTLIK